MHNVLILGDGFIGKNLFHVFSSAFPTTLVDKKIIDVTSRESIKKYFSTHHFSYVIYAVGIKDVSYCENNLEESFAVNAEGVKNILDYCEKSKLIYISTDYVFDGINGNYKETDIPNPQTVYGKTKLAGEKYISQHHQDAMIVRTSGVYGKNCPWLRWLTDAALTEEKILCFDDVYNSPTYVYDLAHMIIDMLKINYNGIINLCGPEILNRFELYNIVFKQYNLDTKKLVRATSTGLIPKNISLDTNLYNQLVMKKSMNVLEGFYNLSNMEI